MAQAELISVATGGMASSWEDSLGEPLWDDANWNDTTDDESDGDEVSPAAATELMIDAVLNLVFAGSLSAKSACVIFWWAGKAGLDNVRRWGFRPDAPTGHYQRHLDSLLGSRRQRQERYHVNIPGYQKHSRGREIRKTPVQVPHEMLDAEAQSDPYFVDTLTRAVDNDELPPMYKACAGEGPLASPVALYTDGVQFINRDSMLGFWVYNILSGARHICLTIRKSWLCRCGCRGRCTLWVARRLPRRRLWWRSIRGRSFTFSRHQHGNEVRAHVHQR